MNRSNGVDWSREGVEFENLTAEEVLNKALQAFHPRIAVASSFQAEESVLVDMISRIWGANFRIFSLDTGRLNQETYECMDKIRERYGVRVDVYFPESQSVEWMVRDHGLNPFYRSVELRKMCCSIRKVEPLKRALAGLNAWITGLRRNQAVTREGLRKVEIDQDHGGILKFNPLADWTDQEVWDYIRQNRVPYNRLHDLGYPSIGCAPCTRGIKSGEDIRAGRWWWENPESKECGLHAAGTPAAIPPGNA